MLLYRRRVCRITMAMLKPPPIRCIVANTLRYRALSCDSVTPILHIFQSICKNFFEKFKTTCFPICESWVLRRVRFFGVYGCIDVVALYCAAWSFVLPVLSTLRDLWVNVRKIRERDICMRDCAGRESNDGKRMSLASRCGFARGRWGAFPWNGARCGKALSPNIREPKRVPRSRSVPQHIDL